MSSQLIIPIGVIVVRETIDHPWQTERWRPASVLLNPPEAEGWRELRRGPDFVQYHAANIELDLHRKETAAYQVNLTHGSPVVYVVLRQDGTDPFPVSVHCATLSPFDAQAHGEDGDEIVEGVPMPNPLRALVEAFIDQHHVDDAFIKRRRGRKDDDEEHQFGQEPLVDLRRRMDGFSQHRGDDA